MSESLPNIGRKIAAGAAVGLVVLGGVSPALGEWGRSGEVQALEACRAYEAGRPETKSRTVTVGSVPKEILAACGLSSYLEGPSAYPYNPDNDPDLDATLGKEIDYSGALVRLPDPTRLENRLTSLKNVDELIVPLGGLGAFLGGTFSFLWAARPKTRIKISESKQT